MTIGFSQTFAAVFAEIAGASPPLNCRREITQTASAKQISDLNSLVASLPQFLS